MEEGLESPEKGEGQVVRLHGMFGLTDGIRSFLELQQSCAWLHCK